ncbi:Long-chain fatty acid transport protein 4 [Trachymyrmex zeteki]|uniref:Long-chain-fatty-acid--CoA ligase n=1 Tax=Mycetomoellerius zeteki TaxID=64791 RepID=A0A151X8U6_9HYME|nr:Long-chain fatty acid transport protein 4 [Trachymyrmex zeteki]
MAKIDIDVNRVSFPSTRFTLDEWHLNNQFRYRCSEAQQELSDRLLAEATLACDSAKEIVKANKEETDHRLLEKLNDIEFRKGELLLIRKDTALEIDALSVYKERITDVLKSVKRNALAICGKCLIARECRLSIDLVYDDVEMNLLKEREVIQGAENLLDRILKKTCEQIRKLKATLYRIDHDLENKENNLHIDRRNVTLKETDFNLKVIYKRTVKHRVVMLNEWELQTNNNVIDANKEMNSSKQLRCYIDTIIKQTIDELNNQKNVTNEAFRQRIEQTREAKTKLELQHSEIIKQVTVMSSNITHLKKSIAEKEGFMALAHTRLGRRCQRPGIEHIQDLVQVNLVKEIHELRNVVANLQRMLYEDIERGETRFVGVSSVSASTSASVSALASAPTPLHETSANRCDVSRATSGVGHIANAPSGTRQDAQTTRASASAALRSERDLNASTSRWKTVGRFLRRLTLIMLLLVAAVGALAVIVIYMGSVYLVQLLIVISVAYFVAGGRMRWFYVALRTIPRDCKGLIGYVRMLWSVHGHGKKNRNVADIFRQHVNRHPNKICFIFEDQEWTFQQIEDFSNKIATIFKTHGYKKGDTVALLLENRPEFIAIWLGLNKLGVITALINTNLRKSSLLHCINIAKCQALIYGTEFFDAVTDIASSLDAKLTLYRFGNHPNAMSIGLKEKDLNTLLLDTPAAPPGVQEKSGYHDKLLYIYTSGTTGLPKAAVITNSRYIFITSSVHYMGILRDSDRIYTPLPLYHTAGGIMAVGLALVYGHTTVIRKKFSASAYFADCTKYKCTVGQYIGEMCRYILAVPSKKEDQEHNIRIIFGNGLRPQIWGEFVKRFKISQVLEFYGATEGNANVMNIDNKMGAIGFFSRIIPSVYPVSLIKVDEDGEPIRNSKGLCQVCEPNEPGAFIGKISPNNPTRAFLGYVDKKASEKKVIHNVFIKGDSAFLSGDILVADEWGYLYFKDRTGDTFRWKGENVSTSEIEGIISNFISYRDCIVYGVEVKGTEGRAVFSADIKEQLPAYARPQFVRILTKIDLTGTFKLKKKDLQEEGYNPHKVQDKLYYLNAKLGYQLLTSEVFDQIQQGKIKF